MLNVLREQHTINMVKTAILAMIICVVVMVQSASVSRQHSNEALSNWLGGLMSQRQFHPGPEPDQQYIDVSPERKQVRCEYLLYYKCI